MENDPDTGALAICALRYCVGRRTYMPGLITDWVKRHWSKLSANDQNVIRNDIQSAIASRELGHACDIETWNSFWEWIQAQQAKD